MGYTGYYGNAEAWRTPRADPWFSKQGLGLAMG